MTTLNQLLPICTWKKRQENNQSHHLRCYSCDGFRECAQKIECPYWTLEEVYKIVKPVKIVKSVLPYERRHD